MITFHVCQHSHKSCTLDICGNKWYQFHFCDYDVMICKILNCFFVSFCFLCPLSMILLDLPSRASLDENQTFVRSDTTAEGTLLSSRSHFTDRVSDPVLNKLVDELLHLGVLSDAEGDAARAKHRADKARDVIDTVRKKGAKASSIMITTLTKCDPFLCEELGFDDMVQH